MRQQIEPMELEPFKPNDTLASDCKAITRIVHLIILMSKRTIPIPDEGRQRRDFIHVLNHYFSRVRIVSTFVAVKFPS